MRKSLLNKSCFLLLLSVMMIVCSCADDKNKSTRLTGTVWIHQFTEEEGVNEAAYALSFGKDKVELYELDKNMHVKELLNQFDYKIIKGKTMFSSLQPLRRTISLELKKKFILRMPFMLAMY